MNYRLLWVDFVGAVYPGHRSSDFGSDDPALKKGP